MYNMPNYAINSVYLWLITNLHLWMKAQHKLWYLCQTGISAYSADQLTLLVVEVLAVVEVLIVVEVLTVQSVVASVKVGAVHTI